MAKIALLIGVSEYEPGLDRLPSAVRDIAAMRQVLTHLEMGEFADAAVTVLPDPDRQTMADAIYHLFANRQNDDLVLLYFSGHGVDDGSEFYFTNRLTRLEQGRLVSSTALEARSVRDWMVHSQSKRKVIILDSCFSSAFARGVTVKHSGSVNPEQFLGGKGTAILTASTRYAETRESLDLSVYTHYLVEGIRTGGADQDDDGFIAIEELHTYASSKVKEAAPAMTPEFYQVKDGDKILLAKSPKHDPSLKYRKQVEQRADRGAFSIPARRLLNSLRLQLGIATEVAEAIEAEVLQPYREYQHKLQEYQQTLSEALQAEFPLSQRTLNDLKDYQQHLALRDEDVSAIEAPLLAPKQADYEQQQAALARLELEKQQQEQARLQEREQAQQRQRALEQQRERELAAQNQPSPPAVNPPTKREAKTGVPLQPFEFETAKLIIAKKPGLFSGNKTTVEINRSRKRAESFTEDLGKGVTLEMVAIPGGTFQMGSNEYDSEKPSYPVTVQPFFMGKYPVTQKQWLAVMGKFKQKPGFAGEKRPIERVSWDDAVEFCTQLSQKTGKTYRLPSEAEWEYACRAGTTTPFYFGETITTDLANYRGTDWEYQGKTYLGNYGNGPKGLFREETTDVGSFPANSFGLYDMHGNVWEWCADHWHDNYQDAPADGSVWETGGDPAQRLLRGGSWYGNPVYCRSAGRGRLAPDVRVRLVGFRVVCLAA